MPITFSCACGQGLKVRDDAAGKAVKCPKCGQAARVPAPEPQPAAPEPDPGFRITEEEPAAPETAPAPARRGPASRPGRPGRSRAGAGRTLPRRRTAAAAGGDARSVILGLVGGVAAAVLGALVWYFIARGIEAKIGWVAWGIGLATGFGVLLLSGGRGGMILPVIGAGTALLGWFLGEYFIYAWMVSPSLEEAKEAARILAEAFAESGEEIPPEMRAELSKVQALGFGDYLKESLDLFDAIFVLLAVATGWGVVQKALKE